MDSEDDSLLAKVAASPPKKPPPNLVRGTRRFELLRLLGRGAFGEVYEARDRESGAPLAVKVLRASGPDRLFRFKREFRAVADLVHPNLVRLHELVEEDEHWYLAMELVDGIPFDEHLRRAPDRTSACFGQLARAIDALHRAGQIHRDIKPKNVLVERTGRVVLLDFGLIVAVDAHAYSVIAGTPAFMAPEQIRGGELGPATDWYAFGVMLYQSLAGALPFERARGPEESARPPSELREGVDPGLERLCLRLLSTDPRARPSADEILVALPTIATDTAPIAREPAAPFVGRTRELAELGAALAGVTEAGALVIVSGPSGAGKTSLVRAFAGEATAQGALVFSGRCHEGESVPLKGLDGVVDAISEHLRRRPPLEAASVLPRDAHALVAMFPVLERVSAFANLPAPRRRASAKPSDGRRAAVRAFRELVTRLADHAPVVLFVDDVQWATDDGLAVLLELLAPSSPPALFVVAHREEGVARSPALERLLSRAATKTIALSS